MTKENTTTKKPCLRFPEFSGEWEEKRLGEVAKSFSGGTPKSSVDNYYGGNIPFIRSGEIHKDKTELFITEEGLNNSSAKMVNKGDLLYALYGATSGEVDLSKIRGAINQAILCIRSEVLDSNYLCNYLKLISNYVISHYLQGGQGNLSSDIIMSLNIIFPSLAEQRKIASCLSEMDNLIVAQEQKVEALRERKKGLMQQLFPQNGQTVPRLRFPEFSGEWEEKRLGEVAEKISKRNNDLKVTKVLTNSANFGIVDQNAYFDRDIAVKENTSNYYVVEIGEFVYNPRISTAAPVGPISLNKVGQGIMSPLYTIFKFHTGYISFYEQYFQTNIWHPYLKSIANFGARFDRMNITMDGFFNLPFLLPPSLAEQQKIASCLSELDNLIAAQAKKTETLKIYKKALLQLMFVNY